MNYLRPLILAAYLAVLSSPSVANDDGMVSSTDFDTKADLSFLKLATVAQPGDILSPGDIIKVSRDFSSWTLRCDLRLSTNRRACFVEQGGVAEQSSVVLRIAMNDQNKPIAVVSAPSDTDMSKGIKLKFAGLEKTLDSQLFRCGPQACIGGFYFEGFVQQAILSSASVGFSFSRKNAGDVNIEMSMAGFSSALDAGAKDPFGRANQHQASGATQEPKRKPATNKKPSAPAPKPVVRNQKTTPKDNQTAKSAPTDKSAGLY